jgi:hypothetical protein
MIMTYIVVDITAGNANRVTLYCGLDKLAATDKLAQASKTGRTVSLITGRI